MRYSGAIGAGLVFFLFANIAGANTLSATGGLQFGRDSGMNEIKNTNPLLGAAYSLDLSPHLELGGFYDYNFLQLENGGVGSLSFMGVMVRYEVEHDRSFFVEAKIGLGEASDSSNTNYYLPSYGVGVGYRFPITSVMSVGPKVDLRYLPESTTPGSGRAAMTDFSMMFSFKL